MNIYQFTHLQPCTLNSQHITLVFCRTRTEYHVYMVIFFYDRHFEIWAPNLNFKNYYNFENGFYLPLITLLKTMHIRDAHI